MPALVRILIDKRMDTKTMQLPELPQPGELIQIPDGTRVIVRKVELTPGGNCIAEVRAKLAAEF